MLKDNVIGNPYICDAGRFCSATGELIKEFSPLFQHGCFKCVFICIADAGELILEVLQNACITIINTAIANDDIRIEKPLCKACVIIERDSCPTLAQDSSIKENTHV